MARPDPLLIGILLAGLALWIVFRLQTRIVLEDALITYRYAENLARGAGFVFNPGERVLGTSTPLLTLLLAGCGALFGVGRIPLCSNALMLAAALGTGWLLHDLLLRGTRSKLIALAAVALWVVHPDTLWTTTGGMETPLMLLLMAGSLDLALRERWHAAAACAGLLVLTRVDGAVWAALLLGAAVMRLRGRALWPILTGLAVVLPWVVFAWLYFGSPVPYAIVAKREIVFNVTINHLAWVLDSLGFKFSTDRTPVEFALWLTFVLLGALTFLFKPGCPRVLRVIVAFTILFPAALVLGRAPVFDWYLIPLTWCALVLGVQGAFTLGEWLRRAVTGQA